MPLTIDDTVRFAVVVCPHCRHAKGIDRTARTTTCARCAARHETATLRVLYATGDAETLRTAVGIAAARLAGGDAAVLDVQALEEEIAATRGLDRARTPPPAPADEDVVQFAASAAAGVVSNAKKARRIFEALESCRPDGWTPEEAEAAFVAAQLPAARADAEIRKALVHDDLYEPRPGRLKLLA